MTLGKQLGLVLCSVLALALAGCTGKSSSSTTNTLSSAVQNLTLDADGLVTVLTFASSGGLSGATSANFESDNGQTALTVTIAGATATVTWDLRVSPVDHVRATGLTGVESVFHAVTTSDSSAPTFVVTAAQQNAGLGTDTIRLTFSGPHVVKATAEQLAHWTLTENATTIDLNGSTFTFQPVSQTLDITLGSLANVFASFTLSANGVKSVGEVALASSAVVGTGAGDAVAPTLVSANQNLGQDEFGRVIDFTFNKAMSPTFAPQIAHFGATLPDIAVSVQQAAASMLRVTFNNPIVPGYDSINLTGLVDLHGNAFADTLQAISQPAPVVNAYDGNCAATTVENAGGDFITIKTTQAFDPDSAVNPSAWVVHVNGALIDLTAQALTYDLLTKTLTIALNFDMVNGTTFTVLGNAVREVDGQGFSLGQFNTVTGETTPPTVVGATQNRTVDQRGKTVDVTLSEDVEVTSAQTLGNWNSSAGQNVTGATLQPGLRVVRLVFDAPVIPTLATLGASGVKDLAGNTMVAQSGVAIGSTDVTPPSLTNATATAVEGANDDTLRVTFDDDMLASEVQTASNWTVLSPVPTAFSSAGASVAYNPAARQATMTFTNGMNFQRGSDFKVTLSGMHDLGHNTITPTPITGNVISETTLPSVQTVYRSSSMTDQLVVRFSEPCAQLTNLWNALSNPDGTRYVLRDAGGALRGTATAAVVLDSGLGAAVSFGIVVLSSDTLDVLGPTDLCGNPLFPALAVVTLAEDTAIPNLVLGGGTLTAISGENNDTIDVVFDRPMSPWQITKPANWSMLRSDSAPVDLAFASFSFDGNATVHIVLPGGTGNNLSAGWNYDVTVDNVWSAQGTQMTVAQTDTQMVGGDLTAPDVLAGKLRLDPATANSILIEFTEGVDQAATENPASYDYNGGNLATSATLISPRVARVTFGVTPVVGNSVTFTPWDLADNSPGSISRTITAADVTAPLVSSVSGRIKTGWGGDLVTITFNEPVSSATALNALNYTVTSNGTTLSLAGAVFSYDGNTNAVTIHLVGGQELDGISPVSVAIANIKDVSGNIMAAPVTVGGPVTGDTTAPSFSGAFVNWLVDATGKTVDVRFSEDVSSSYATLTSHWTASGGQTVSAVQLFERDHYRLTLSAALGLSQTLAIANLPDLAQNAAGLLSVDPTE